jgi:hypothetical protein
MSGARGAGEADAVDARVTSERRADDRSRTGQELERRRRHTRLVQQRDGTRGHQRRLLGGLGEHGIADHERGRDLAGEDREREIPRRDAREYPAGLPASGARLGFGRVVAQEIDCLAELGNGVGEGLASLARRQREQLASMRLVEIRGAAQARGARLERCRRPGRVSSAGRRERGLDVGSSALDHLPDRVLRAGGVGDSVHRRALDRPRDERRGMPAMRAEGQAPGLELREISRVGEVPAARVAPKRPVERIGARDGGTDD